MKLTLGDLPEVLVKFETVRANRGKVIYTNKSLGHNLSSSELLSRYNYITVDTAIESDNFRDRKVFFAERYGGDGISTNGGGGRCGFDGAFQLKGLGPNQLVGIRPWNTYGNSHANGLLSLDVAVYESIWAEIINIALPYGAVRTVAVIDLELDFDEPDQKHPRGLLVRLPAIRPAHFIRALYFKEKKFDILSEDAKRVKKAIYKLAHFLPTNNPHEAINNIEAKLEYGLAELATRYAKQFAAARVKKIFHQSISASNITLDGAWMDLAGCTVFSDKMWWDGFNIDQFNKEYMPAIQSIRDMCYYLKKYNVISEKYSAELLSHAYTSFERELKNRISLFNATQAGFPMQILETLIDDPAFLDFSTCLKKILALDNFSVTPVNNVCGWDGFDHWTSRIYIQLLNRTFKKDASDFSWLCNDLSLVDQLCLSYENLFEIILKKSSPLGVTRKNLGACLLISSTRKNRFNSLLITINKRITEVRKEVSLSKKTSLYQKLFDDATRVARHTFSCDESFLLFFWEGENSLIQYDALTGQFIARLKSHGPSNLARGTAADIKLFTEDMNTALSFYGEALKYFHE